MDKTKNENNSFDAFLPKPIDTKKLFTLIEKLVPSLTWILAPQAKKEKKLFLPFVPPPMKYLKKLHQSAMYGNIKEIRTWTAEIESLHKKYSPFVHRLKELSKVYEVRQIANLTKKMMEKKQ